MRMKVILEAISLAWFVSGVVSIGFEREGVLSYWENDLAISKLPPLPQPQPLGHVEQLLSDEKDACMHVCVHAKPTNSPACSLPLA